MNKKIITIIAIVIGLVVAILIVGLGFKNTQQTTASITEQSTGSESMSGHTYDPFTSFAEYQSGMQNLDEEAEEQNINQTIDGKKEGYWKEKSENFYGFDEGYYGNGIREGEWQESGSFYSQWKGTYKNGQKEGIWTKTEQDGSIAEYTYIDNKIQGAVTATGADGTMRYMNFLDGQLHGEYKVVYPNGEEFGGTYVNGLEEGIRTERWSDNEIATITYVNGQEMGKKTIQGPDYITVGTMHGYDKEGEWITTYNNGIVIGGIYSGDVKIGIRKELQDGIVVTKDYGEGTTGR